MGHDKGPQKARTALRRELDRGRPLDRLLADAPVTGGQLEVMDKHDPRDRTPAALEAFKQAGLPNNPTSGPQYRGAPSSDIATGATTLPSGAYAAPGASASAGGYCNEPPQAYSGYCAQD